MLKKAKETISNYAAVRANNAQSRSNLNAAAIQVAQKKYKAATGKTMTPSFLKAELNSGFPSKSTNQYLKDKKEARSNYKKRFGL